MPKRRFIYLGLGVALGAGLGFFCFQPRAGESTPADSDNAQKIKALMGKIAPLHTLLGKPKPGDWLSQHAENGQTFDEYLDCKPVLPRGARRVIYVQPVGGFTPSQRKIVSLTADFMARYFGVPVKISEDLPLHVIPKEAQRIHPQWGDRQILSTYVLDTLLPPRLPEDAAAYIAFTATDLWPGEGWNFVFGQASLRKRVGVWSIYRNGSPETNVETFKLCLLRTIKTATHETGHMFSMQHCIKYECNMCGSNNREESDTKPLWLCPECVAKVWWGSGVDAVERYKSLADFCKENGLKDEQAFYEKSMEVLRAK
jgi:archaemetzincin